MMNENMATASDDEDIKRLSRSVLLNADISMSRILASDSVNFSMPFLYVDALYFYAGVFCARVCT